MAIHSLIDNVNETIRVFSRCKNALISKGVSPSLKATDIPSEIESIQVGGGTQVSIGNFTIPAGSGQDYFIDCGFKPTVVVWVRVSGTEPTDPNNDVRYMFDKEWGDFSFYSTTSRTPTKVSFGSNTQLCINAITDTGFQLRRTNAAVNFKYYAIGDRPMAIAISE